MRNKYELLKSMETKLEAFDIELSKILRKWSKNIRIQKFQRL